MYVSVKNCMCGFVNMHMCLSVHACVCGERNVPISAFQLTQADGEGAETAMRLTTHTLSHSVSHTHLHPCFRTQTHTHLTYHELSSSHSSLSHQTPHSLSFFCLPLLPPRPYMSLLFSLILLLSPPPLSVPSWEFWVYIDKTSLVCVLQNK